MKKKTNKTQTDDMLPEYDLKGKKGARGKYAKALQKGYSVRVVKADGTVNIQNFVPKENVVLLDPDVKAYFPDSESVNHALRSLINLIPEKKVARVAEKQRRYGRK
jgi:cellobiose-specific phosphotransferase system component IIB